ncbi:enoyl-CoA hydratase [Bordetella holmesii]|uniref:Enoyl-CoA hydratase/isomerase family protein n=2 Tax=Bordetella holmesii TaxID=35814 RepID=A0A158LZV8_9BORD|nr:enoyl-CoA hydratase [Bordetella holmesii]AHV94795.1 enoyl-CoA hydratase/isomerase family protein [Bordetella holmesii ATCC 51541]AIT25541.1 enoyl-CoA hydratase/isomerase family protein [Bordetella holmesii 44057]EWM43730.1 enoyl-CoA hydratase/isomerase family protein [Bordetella holmesii 41130]EWM46107.1 enoyl-CoA hydratase/isomerase family protein [Bordetella holmesii 35009]EWM50261.1 enoyl-CoA hydratase/isomerase family protein [Bordetella holmesii 70147]
MQRQRILQDRVTEHLIVEKRGSAGWITFNDPERHNAVSFAMWEGIPLALQALADDPAIRVVVLSGAGERAFVSGANISQFDTLRSGEQAVQAYERVAEAAQLALYNYEKPTIARIKGYCIGGGLNIALCCDLRLASEDSSFAIPAGKLGLGYRMTAIRNLVTATGAARALEIFLTAARYPAPQALHLGLLHKVVPAAELDVELQTYIDQIGANAPLTLMAGKKMIRQMQQLGPQIDLQAMTDLVLACFESNDYREGRRAFAEKRSPVFTGT